MTFWYSTRITVLSIKQKIIVLSLKWQDHCPFLTIIRLISFLVLNYPFNSAPGLLSFQFSTRIKLLFFQFNRRIMVLSIQWHDCCSFNSVPGLLSFQFSTKISVHSIQCQNYWHFLIVKEELSMFTLVENHL